MNKQNSLPDLIVRAIHSVVGKDPVDLHEPTFAGNEWRYVKECLDSTFVSSVGKYVNRFEEDLTTYTGSKHVVAVVNGTAALHVALLLAGVKANDEVLVPALTFIATANAISYCGSTPHFVDSEDATLGMDTAKLREYLEVHTQQRSDQCINIATGQVIRAMVPMHTYGHPAKIDHILDISREYNLKVVEDAAQSFGGSIGENKVGNFGDVAATSFYPAKPLGCYGDGGAIFTNDDNLAEECKAIRIHGTKSDKYNSEMIGLNGRLDSIQAAVLLEKLNIFDNELEMRNEIDRKYRIFVNNAQFHPKEYQSAHALFSITLAKQDQRDKLIDRLSKSNIPSVIYYKLPIHLMQAFSYLGYIEGDLPVSENLSKTIVSLPMHPYLSKIDIDFIVETIQKK